MHPNATDAVVLGLILLSLGLGYLQGRWSAKNTAEADDLRIQVEMWKERYYELAEEALGPLDDLMKMKDHRAND